jgi:type IX secretion system PorP/SprF family membrane protein
MKRLSVLLVVCITATVALAQQDPLYSQYINNPFVLNPAYAGLTNNLNATISYRLQWAGFEGNPTTVNANGHISLLNNTMGVGLMIVSDHIGATTTNEVYGSYAYRIRIDDGKTLSFGLQAGFTNFKTDNAKLTIQDPNDPLFTGESTGSKPNVGTGVILTSDNFFVGLSVPRLLKTKTAAGEFDPTLYTQHFYAMGSYIFFVSDRLRFRPSVLAKVVSGAPVSVDLNTAFILHENYTAGILTRNFSTYGAFLQALIKNSFRFGYAFEMPTNKSIGTRFSTHEITLGLRLNVLSFHVDSGVPSF